MKSFFTLIFCLQFFLLNAQGKQELSGAVQSFEHKTLLADVAITVFEAKTNILIDYTYSNEKGKYKLQVQKGKSVYIKADLLGYKNYKSDSFLVADDFVKNISLNESAQELEEVVVFQKKKLIQLKGDKLIYNIENSGIGEGNNGLETLSKLPGMRLDKDENIVFRGSSNLQVQINGKRSLLTGDALTQFLKTVGGENIKNIEIISNPSARYDAEGTAGVVNIELKKGYNTGLTGSVNSSLGGDYYRNSNGANLYYQSGKWNLNFDGRYARFNSVNNRAIIRTVNNPNNIETAEQLNDWLPKSKAYSSKIGIEYSIDKNQTIGSSFNYNKYLSDNETLGKTNEYVNLQKKRYTILNEQTNEDNSTLTANLYYNFQSDSLATKLTLQVNYANYKNSKDQLTSNEYFLVTDSKYQNDFIIRLNNPTNYNIINTKVDLEQKINTNFSFETGLKYSFVDNDYNNKYAIKDSNGNFVPNMQRSNHLLYKETIFSGYGILAYHTKKWSLQAGLRAEHINYKTNSLTTNTIKTKQYTSWFPSFSVNRIYENDKLQFSYSRRIQRPKYLDLNPFYEYLDTYNVSVGNPNLQPQFTQAFNTAWIHNQKTSLSIYSNFNTDVIDDKVIYDSSKNITVNSKDNIASSVKTGLSFSTSFHLKNWWTLYVNSDLSYNRVKSTIVNYQFNIKGSNWYANINNEFSLKNNWKLFFEGYYDNGGANGNWKYKPSYDMSFRIRKTWNQNKWKVQLKADNILKKNLFSAIITQGNVVTDWINKWETRRVSLSLTYNFGSGKEKSIKQADLQDEKSRL